MPESTWKGWKGGGDTTFAPSSVPTPQQRAERPNGGPKAVGIGGPKVTTRPLGTGKAGDNFTLEEMVEGVGLPVDRLLQALQGVWQDELNRLSPQQKSPFKTLLEHLNNDKDIEDVRTYSKWYSLRHHTETMSAIILVRIMQLLDNISSESAKACGDCNANGKYTRPSSNPGDNITESVLLLEKYVQALNGFDRKTGSSIRHFGEVFRDRDAEKNYLRGKINKKELVPEPLKDGTSGFNRMRLIENMRVHENLEKVGKSTCDSHRRICRDLAKLLNHGFDWKENLKMLNMGQPEKGLQEDCMKNCEKYHKLYYDTVQQLKSTYISQIEKPEPEEKKTKRTTNIFNRRKDRVAEEGEGKKERKGRYLK